MKGIEKWLAVASSAVVEFVAVTLTFVVVVAAAAVAVTLAVVAAPSISPHPSLIDLDFFKLPFS